VVEAGEDRHTLSCYTKTVSILRDFAMQFLDRLALPLGQGGQPLAGLEQPQGRGSPYRFNRRRNGGWNRVGRATASAAECSAPRGRDCRGQTCV
jgi:hypothetical protein